MRLAFMGTPDFAVTALDALIKAGHEIVAVYTQPPRPANRGRVTPSPVHVRAEELGLPVHTPISLRSDEEKAKFAALDLDAAVVAAYGLLLPQEVLDAPKHGCLNIHGSILPRWRGAAPIQRAVLQGDETTGVTIMQMERGLDTGPMLAIKTTPVARKTSGELFQELAVIGADLMVEVLADLNSFTPEIQSQDLATHAAKIDKAEAKIDWTRSAIDLDRLVRGMQPAPGAWFESNGQRVKLIQAEPAADAGSGVPGTMVADNVIATGNGALRLITVQPEGKGKMQAADWLRGRRLAVGEAV